MNFEATKVFVVGANKTGTTSLGEALKDLGFRLGDQAGAELLMEDWARRDFRKIVEYCDTADAFQDVPFSLDFTYGILDHVFPRSKFILTVRNSSQEWYDSVIRFHVQILGKHRLPTALDLKEFPYREVGWVWRAHELIYGIDEQSLFDREVYIRKYELRNLAIIEYFRYRPSDLLILNLSAPDAMESLCRFLGCEWAADKTMPHLNTSRASDSNVARCPGVFA